MDLATVGVIVGIVAGLIAIAEAVRRWRKGQPVPPDGPPAPPPPPSTPQPRTIPLPPLPHFAHPYPLQKHFTGRVAYRKLLTRWLARGDCPILALTAIGGTGKSALAWAWVQRDVLGNPLPGAVPTGRAGSQPAQHDADPCRLPEDSRPEGILWWSFYERESTFSAFLNEAITYSSAGQVNPADIRSDYEKIRKLIQLLQGRHFLLVLDGFERQLRAYTSLNAPYQGDAVEEDERGDFRSCSDLNLARFLQESASLAIQSRLLLTTRLFPRELDDTSGCESKALTDMDPDEAVAFFHAHGIKGTRAQIQAACAPYGYHPFSLRLLAGLIAKDKQDAGDIRAAQRYAVVPHLKGKERHHILQVAYDTLDKRNQTLLSQIAAFRSPMAYDAIAHLNPYGTEQEFDAALQELIDRGLLLHDTEDNRYDLHPVVRQFAYDRLADKEGTHTRLRDYFATIPQPDKIESLADLAPTIELYHHTVNAGRYDDAQPLLRDRLGEPLYYRFGAYQTCIDLLCALFPDGEDKPPRPESEGAQAWVLNELANSYALSGQPRRAERLVGRHNALREGASNRPDVAIGLSNLAAILLLLGRLTAAEQSARQSIHLSRDIQAEHQEAVARQELGPVLFHQGAFDAAALELDAASSAFTNLKDAHRQCLVSAYLAEHALLVGEADHALRRARRARALADKEAMEGYPVERDFVQAEWLIGAALVSLAAEDEGKQAEHLNEAEADLTDALTRCRRINLVELEPDILLAWARWHHVKGDPSQARKHAHEALSTADRCEYRLKQADCHNFLAALDQQEDDTNAAVEHAQTAYERAWCDGPPHCYKPALDEATRLLKVLGAAPPPVP